MSTNKLVYNEPINWKQEYEFIKCKHWNTINSTLKYKNNEISFSQKIRKVSQLKLSVKNTIYI